MSRKIILLAAIAAVVLATAVPALAGSWSPNNSGKGTFANHKDFPGLVDIGEDRKMYLAKAHSGLMAGTEYTSSVRATDAPGNPDATPATSTFTPLEIITNVRDFGATGNGTSNDTAAFERAMAEAARVGGVVYVPAPGNYRIANVHPPSNTRLQVQAGASLKKYGSDNGPLFNVEGPNDTTFVNNVHIEGVGGTFTIDLYDAGSDTAGIRYRNVRNFSLRNMICIQNNDNPTQEDPSSRKPCISFLPQPAGPVNGVYNHPIDGVLENIHSIRSPYG